MGHHLRQQVHSFITFVTLGQDSSPHLDFMEFARRNLSRYQRSVLALKLEDMIRARAKRNQLPGLKQYQAKSVCQNSDKRIDTKGELASLANVSHDTIWKVKQIEEKAAPEQKEG